MLQLHKAWADPADPNKAKQPNNWIDDEAPSIGIVPYLRPKDSNYDMSTMTGVATIVPPIAGGYCAVCLATQGADECAGKNVDPAELKQVNPVFAQQDLAKCPGKAYQPLTPSAPLKAAGSCKPPCTYGTDCIGCIDEATCESPSGCPVAADQVMFWVQQVNAEVRKQFGAIPGMAAAIVEKFVIADLVLDSEDAGDWGMTQFAQTGWRRGAAGGPVGGAPLDCGRGCCSVNVRSAGSDRIISII